ncbi:MAG TPA: hypothetical protein IAA40_01425 [Candidatus Olsenella excrementigallinarum]|nr:hypothetical protein [Candidatus Olsenella excrementigallinarum]
MNFIDMRDSLSTRGMTGVLSRDSRLWRNAAARGLHKSNVRVMIRRLRRQKVASCDGKTPPVLHLIPKSMSLPGKMRLGQTEARVRGDFLITRTSALPQKRRDHHTSDSFAAHEAR